MSETSIQFYHLLHTPLERALPKLLEKVLSSGSRALIRTADEARAEWLADQLWTYDPASFLPHGTRKDGDDATAHPIYVTAAEGNPNNADILILTDGSTAEALNGFSKLLDMFDGNNEDTVTAARQRWSHYKSLSLPLAYYKQQPSGGWEKAA